MATHVHFFFSLQNRRLDDIISGMAQSASTIESGTENLLEELRAAYAANPADLKAATHLAEHYADLGWLNESLELYRALLAENGNDYFLLLGYGNTCCRHRRRR